MGFSLLYKLYTKFPVFIIHGWLGTKFKPKERTSFYGEVRILEEGLVMYISLCSNFWISFCVCLRAALLVFLLLYLGWFLLLCTFTIISIIKQTPLISAHPLLGSGFTTAKMHTGCSTNGKVMVVTQINYLLVKGAHFLPVEIKA